MCTKAYKIIFSLFLATVSPCLFSETVSNGQKFIEGRDYKKIDGNIKIPNEVKYFYWYGSPWAFDLQPEINKFVEKNPSVNFISIPVYFQEQFFNHSILFYAIQKLNRADLNEKVLFAIHKGGQRLLDENQVLAWASNQGVDSQLFLGALRSPDVRQNAVFANQQANIYKVQYLPTLIINNIYLIDVKEINSRNNVIEVMKFLLTDTNDMLNLDEVKKKCIELGFSSGTEKFGQCVLKLSK